MTTRLTRLPLRTTVKIKKTHTTSTSTKGTKRKSAKQELPSDAASEESELSPAFLDADILDWDGVSTWQAPPFTDAELASVPYDSPLGTCTRHARHTLLGSTRLR